MAITHEWRTLFIDNNPFLYHSYTASRDDRSHISIYTHNALHR